MIQSTHHLSIDNILDLCEVEGPHFTDDPECTYLWSTNSLPENEKRELNAHLGVCLYCQTEIADMILCGALSAPLVIREPATVTSARTKRSYGVFQALVAVCAACLLIVVFGILPTGKGPIESEVAIVQSKPELWLVPSTRSVPVTKNIDSDHPDVVQPDNVSEIEKQFLAVSEATRQNPQYKIAYGQFLSQNGRVAEAKQWFIGALDDESTVTEAKLGLALVAFMEKDYPEAARLFDELGELQDLPEVVQFIIAYNTASTAKELKRRGDAKKHWEKAGALLDTPALRDWKFQTLKNNIEHELELYDF